MALATLRWCRDTVRQLKDKPGFPELRIIKGTKDYTHNAAWGGPQPAGDMERGRYFGYSEKVCQVGLV